MNDVEYRLPPPTSATQTLSHLMAQTLRAWFDRFWEQALNNFQLEVERRGHADGQKPD